MTKRVARVAAAQRRRFLEILTETSSVAMAAAGAGVSVQALYRLRDGNAGFAAEWRRALEIGYELIEGALLGVARGAGAATDFDVGLAKHLLQQRDVRAGKAGAGTGAATGTGAGAKVPVAVAVAGGGAKRVALADVEAEVMRLLTAGDKAAAA